MFDFQIRMVRQLTHWTHRGTTRVYFRNGAIGEWSTTHPTGRFFTLRLGAWIPL